MAVPALFAVLYYSQQSKDVPVAFSSDANRGFQPPPRRVAWGPTPGRSSEKLPARPPLYLI